MYCNLDVNLLTTLSEKVERYGSGSITFRQGKKKAADGTKWHLLRPFELKMAERGGFEPPETEASAVFKTAALNHSTISPFGNAL